MFRFWRIFGLFVLFTLVESKKSVLQTPGANDDFKSVIYNLTLMPNFQKSTFDGLLLLRVIPKREVSKFSLSKGNYNVNVTIEGVELSDLVMEQKNETLTLNLAKPLTKGQKYVIKMYFNDSKIRNDMTGFYKTQISESEWIYLTNFNPAHAIRKVFPCFNVTSMRSTVVLNFKLPSEPQFQVLTNSRRKKLTGKTFTFQSISNTSVNNLAFAIFTNFSFSRGITNDNVAIKLYARHGKLRFTTFAKQKMIEVMDELSQTFGVKYPFKKLDFIAVPDYVPRKISNLGLMVIPEYFLFYDKKNFSLNEELRVTKSISRACASMWLQNIVTPAIWGQAWIGEGLVKYYEYFASHKGRHNLRLKDQFVIEVFQKSMLEDSLESKNIRIDRAASILKMFESTVGEMNFTTNLQRYLKSRGHESANMHDFVKAFDHKGILSNYFAKNGYPVVTVNVHRKNITLSAEKFSLYPKTSIEDEKPWKIPLKLVNINPGKFSKARIHHSKKPETIVSNVKNAIIILSRKNLLGYYRVNYDTKTWNKIVQLLRRNHTELGTIDRAAILDDMFNLARSGSLNYDILFRGLKYLENETEYLPLKTSMNGLNHLLNVFSNQTDNQYLKLLHWTQSLFKPLYEKLSIGRDSLLAREISRFACSIGDQKCFADAIHLFEESERKNKSIPGDLRSVVYCNVLKYENYFDAISKKLKQVSTSSEKLDVLKALGCSYDFENLKLFLTNNLISFKKSGIYKTELFKVMESIYTSSLAKCEWMLSFLKDNYQRFVTYFKGTQEVKTVIYEMGKMYNSESMVKLLVNLKKQVENDDVKLLIQETIERMHREMQASKMIVRKLAKVFDNLNITSSTMFPKSTMERS